MSEKIIVISAPLSPVSWKKFVPSLEARESKIFRQEILGILPGCPDPFGGVQKDSTKNTCAHVRPAQGKSLSWERRKIVCQPFCSNLIPSQKRLEKANSHCKSWSRKKTWQNMGPKSLLFHRVLQGAAQGGAISLHFFAVLRTLFSCSKMRLLRKGN